jgi:iron complex transport system substrate-binding protein
MFTGRNHRLLALVASTAVFSFVIVDSSHAATPRRIISLSPSATEDLFAIGAGPQVIAVDSLSNFPSSAPVSKLDAFSPNVEAIAAFKPDLVVLNADATKADSVKTALQKLKIKVYFESAPTDLNGAFEEINALGKLTGRAASAAILVRKMKSTISKAIISAKKQKNSLTFFHELDDTLYSVTSETFIGKVYKDLGLTNVADVAAKADSYGYPQLSAEYLVQSNPALIFLADAQYGVTASNVAARPGWSTMKAVVNKKVIPLPDDLPSRWGPRLADFYLFIAKVLSDVR